MPAAAASYDFTLIADTVTGPFKSLTRTPSINNSGTVAFSAGWAGTYPGGRIAVYTGSGGPLTTIVDSADGVFYTFSLGAYPMINDAGTVAFFGVLNETGQRGIFTGDGTSTTTIALEGDTYSTFGFIPSINDEGVVAFQASLTAGGQGIFAVDGTSTTTIATTTTDLLGVPEINNSGEVAYWKRSGAFPGPFTFAIFKGDGTTTTPIAQTGGGSSFVNVGSYPAINDGGTVAFVATYFGGQGIFTGSGGPTTKIVDSSGPYSNSFFSGNYHAFTKPGEVAFQIGLDTGGSGIFTGPDSVADKVIQTGDPLFGSTVTDFGLGFFRDGLNDKGQLAFWAKLADGREVIARATPTIPPASALTLTKDAAGSYDDTFRWTITKDVDKTIVKQIGGSATFNYSVSVSHGDSEVGNVKVTGMIIVTNPNGADVTIGGVTDTLGGASCTVTNGGSQTLPPGDTSFGYECDLSGLPQGSVTNTATVSWATQNLGDGSHLTAGSASFTTGAVSFTSNEVDQCAEVSDTYVGVLGTVCVGDPNPMTFNYSRTVLLPQTGCESYGNTATFVTNDTGSTGSASQTVTVCGLSQTGALGMGFWATRNGQSIIASYCDGGPPNLRDFLLSYSPFGDLSSTATCSQLGTYVFNVIRSASGGGASMNALLKGQMLATALVVYFSDPALGGNRINAPAPIGGIGVDLTLICTDLTCTVFEDASTVFPSNSGGKESVADLLVDAANASNSGGSLWYGNVKDVQELAKDTFDALNNQKVFDP